MSKPDTIAITIYPSGAATDDLTVSDAMQQVLDTFELLSIAEPTSEGGSDKIVWRLEKASTNSPLTIEAIAVSSNPEIAIGYQAQQAKLSLFECIDGVMRAKAKADWLGDDAEKIARRMFERNRNGVGRMDIDIFDKDAPLLIIDQKNASRAINFLDLKAAEEAAKKEDLTRHEFGSVEVIILGTTRHYNRPAINVKLRLTGENAKCVLTQHAAEKIGPTRNWSETWSDQRGLVRGKIHYNSDGRIVLVDAEDISLIENKNISLSEIDALPRLPEVNISDFLIGAWGTNSNE